MMRVAETCLALIAIVLSGCRLNHRPDAPTPSKWIRRGVTGATYRFAVQLQDQDGDSCAARFDWGDRDTSDWSEYLPSDTFVTMTKSWASAGVYEVRLQARDARGDLSSWSEPESVTIGTNHEPLMPTWEIRIDHGVTNSTYHFAVCLDDPDGDSCAARFDWGDGDTSDWSEWVEPRALVTATKVWTQPGTYSVCVQARDFGNSLSEWNGQAVRVAAKPVLKWKLDVGGSGEQPCPAIGPDGTIYLGFCAVSPEGRVLWEANAAPDRTSPALGPDAVYVTSSGHREHLCAFNLDGSIRWIDSTACYTTSPAVGADGTIYVGAGHDSDGCLSAISPVGNVRWRCPIAEPYESSPAIGVDGTVYIGYDTAYAINPDGTLRWARALYGADGRRKSGSGGDCPLTPSPAIGPDGTVYFSNRGCLCAFAPEGDLLWTHDSFCEYYSPIVGPDGTVYVAYDPGLAAFSPEGQLRWAQEPVCWEYTATTLGGDGTTYCPYCIESEEGDCTDYLRALYPDGSEKWRYRFWEDVLWGPVTIGPDSTAYFVTDAGYLYALKVWEGPCLTGWPKFRRDLRNTGCVSSGRN